MKEALACAVLLTLCVSGEAFGGWSEPVNLGAPINSIYPEAGCDVTPDGSMIVFASGRPGGYGHLDIWMSTLIGGVWTTPVNLGPLVNSVTEDTKVSLSPDGLTLYFRSDRLGSRDLFQSVWDGSAWGPATLLPGAINTVENEYGGSITADGVSYIGSVQRAGLTQGDADLAISNFDGAAWSPFVIIPELASPYDRGCHIGADPDEMIIDSDDLGGFGSYDLWSSTRVGGVWQTPVNLGPVVNSNGIDWNPSLDASGNLLYFASLRSGVLGGEQADIYVCVRTPDVEIPFADINCDGKIDAVDIATLIDAVYFGGVLVPCCPTACE